MDSPSVTRIGDPAAPRWIGRGLLGRRALVFVLLCALVVITLVYATTQAFLSGEPLRASSPFVAAIAFFVFLLAASIVWAAVWRKSRVGLKRAASEHPTSFVTAARMPSVDLPEGAAWLNAPPVGNRIVILIVGEGVLVLTGTDGSPLLKALEPEILELEPVEYVEQGKAYDGIAIRTATAPGGVVLQPIELRGLWVQHTSFRQFAAVMEKIQSALRVSPAEGGT